jgi:propanol-preferring alcohol dehydrogenase
VCYLAAAGKLKIDADRFPFDKIPDAYQALRDGNLVGRAVITFD